MCGIVGYIGDKEASHVLLNGLRRLEYRGYDSAGLSLTSDSGLRVIKRKGRLEKSEGHIRHCGDLSG